MAPPSACAALVRSARTPQSFAESWLQFLPVGMKQFIGVSSPRLPCLQPHRPDYKRWMHWPMGGQGAHHQQSDLTKQQALPASDPVVAVLATVPKQLSTQPVALHRAWFLQPPLLGNKQGKSPIDREEFIKTITSTAQNL